MVNLLRAKTISKCHTLVQRSLVVFFNYFTIVLIFWFSVAGAAKRENKSLFLPLVELETRTDVHPNTR